ncbi:MAG: hypothetical protein OD815_001948 [Candidatus Alkanophagales archaeon MCA70_species_2]|nr:hypothetical protein [Candidatus Alkanophaga liquidiphilum]
MITEDELYSKLLKLREEGKINITLKDIEIIPNYKLKDSPDFILKVILRLSLPFQDFRMEIPLPLELEKAGVPNALEDLQKFIEREKFSLILPMLVVSDKNILSQEKEEKIKVKFEIKQIPYRLIK